MAPFDHAPVAAQGSDLPARDLGERLRAVSSPLDAEQAIRLAAQKFASDRVSIDALSASFHEHLYDLCRERPLSGDLLHLFQELERWEASVSPDREQIEMELRTTAARLKKRVMGGQKS